jgi:NAD(P)-dependent dehydrogenase (short-subunit alcohol dehydrogenase family)
VAGLLEGKIGVITGAGSGIGRACAMACAADGAAAIVAADVDELGARATLENVRSSGADGMVVACDVSRSADVEAMVDAPVREYGRIDFAINCAGISHRNGRIVDIDEIEFDRVLSVNLKGVWLCLKFEIARMLESGGGAIVNIASRAGLRGASLAGGYAASKHGVVGLTSSAAVGYVEDGIRVNCICPGVVMTPLVAALPPERLEQLRSQQTGGRLAEPSEIAQAAVWLCSERASFVSGVALPVDKGWTAGD